MGLPKKKKKKTKQPKCMYLGKETSGHNYVTRTFCKVVLNFLGFFQYEEGLTVKEILP